jgi:predicted DNA binding CopG/RHH family protein
MKRRVPRLTTDEGAEAFLESDLSDLDFSQFKSGRLRFEEGSGSPKTRLPPAVSSSSPNSD